MIARPATPGNGLDVSARATHSWWQKRWNDGYTWCADYVPLPGFSAAQIRASCISAAELADRVAIGYEVTLIQHPRYPDWDPRAHSGVVDGAFAAQYALDIGAPVGMHIGVDWEGMIVGLPAAAAKVYLESWASRALAASFRALEYCGWRDPMNAEQRYELHGITSYWSDAGHRAVATRGCSIHQGEEVTLDGVRADLDTLQPDLLGEVPWAACASADVA